MEQILTTLSIYHINTDFSPQNLKFEKNSPENQIFSGEKKSGSEEPPISYSLWSYCSVSYSVTSEISSSL